MSETTNEEVRPEAAETESNETLKVLLFTGLIIFVLGMGIFGWANAAYFRMVCEKIGLISPSPETLQGDAGSGAIGRSLDVYFSAAVNDNLPIAFSVVDSFQRTNINKRTINDYRFRNLSDRTIYFRPVHDVFPRSILEASGRLVLEKCFCFDEQKLDPGQAYVLPVVYKFTDEIDQNIGTIRMNYALFASTKERYEAANVTYEEALAASANADNHGPAAEDAATKEPAPSE